jgi:hypothetical protein
MLEGNEPSTGPQAGEHFTENLQVANPTIAVISSIALAFVQSVFLVAVWDTSTKKFERQKILTLEISFFSRVIDLGKVSGEFFLQVPRTWCRCRNAGGGAAAKHTKR